MAVPFIGLGTTISIAGTALAQVVSMTPLSAEVGSVETSFLGSSWKTYIPTLADGGSYSAEIHLDPSDTTHQSLQALLTTPAIVAVVVTLKTTKTISFSAFLTKYDVSVGIEDVVSASIEFKITGPVTFA